MRQYKNVPEECNFTQIRSLIYTCKMSGCVHDCIFSHSVFILTRNYFILSAVPQMRLRTSLWSFCRHSQSVVQTHHSTNLSLHLTLAQTTHQEWGEYIFCCLIFSLLEDLSNKFDFCSLKLSNLNQKKRKNNFLKYKGKRLLTQFHPIFH